MSIADLKSIQRRRIDIKKSIWPSKILSFAFGYWVVEEEEVSKAVKTAPSDCHSQNVIRPSSKQRHGLNYEVFGGPSPKVKMTVTDKSRSLRGFANKLEV